MSLYRFKNETLVSVPVLAEDDPVRKMMRLVGLGQFAVLDREGNRISVCVESTRETLYTRALDEIKTEEDGVNSFQPAAPVMSLSLS